MKTQRLTREDAMLVLGINRQETTDILSGMCSDTELLNRYELLHKLVTGERSGLMDHLNEDEDIRIKIARERLARQARIKAARRAMAARLAGVVR